MVVTQVERDVRVDSVDSVDRTGEGWRVAGTLYNGEGFTCHIGSDGRIDTVDYAGFAARGERPLGDDRYRAAWANVDGQSSEPAPQAENGRASCRERGGQIGLSLVVAGCLKKKNAIKK